MLADGGMREHGLGTAQLTPAHRSTSLVAMFSIRICFAFAHWIRIRLTGNKEIFTIEMYHWDVRTINWPRQICQNYFRCILKISFEFESVFYEKNLEFFALKIYHKCYF